MVPCFLLFPSSSRFLILNIHPIGLGAIFPALGALGMFYSLAFLFKTGCIDPGIVPRSRPDEVAYMTALGEEGMCMCVYVCVCVCVCVYVCVCGGGGGGGGGGEVGGGWGTGF